MEEHHPHLCLRNDVAIVVVIVDRDTVWVRDNNNERDDDNRVDDMIFLTKSLKL